MSDTYSDVDASSNVDEAIEWQERIDQWPAIAAYKQTMDLQIGTTTPMLDIGAGPGGDADRVRAFGLDLSHAMAKRAASQGVPVVVGDAHRLPIGDNTMAGVRSDRVLQHLAEPRKALEEMFRVLRPGGRLVVADPDQRTLSITVPGVPDRITAAIRRLRRDVGYRNGCLAPEVPGMLSAMGMIDVQVEASALVLTDPELAFGLLGWVDRWAAEGGFTPADDQLWRAQLAATAGTGFVYAVTYLVTSAVKT